MRFQTRRIYEPPSASDGRRILIDRLWPRGLSKERARVDYWARDVAPSAALRRFYQHDPEKWPEFRRRYLAELDGNPEGVAALRAALGRGMNSIVFASKEEALNNATVMVEYLEALHAAEDASSP